MTFLPHKYIENGRNIGLPHCCDDEGKRGDQLQPHTQRRIYCENLYTLRTFGCFKNGTRTRTHTQALRLKVQ